MGNVKPCIRPHITNPHRAFCERKSQLGFATGNAHSVPELGEPECQPPTRQQQQPIEFECTFPKVVGTKFTEMGQHAGGANRMKAQFNDWTLPPASTRWPAQRLFPRRSYSYLTCLLDEHSEYPLKDVRISALDWFSCPLFSPGLCAAVMRRIALSRRGCGDQVPSPASMQPPSARRVELCR